jgi:hypothetical protein
LKRKNSTAWKPLQLAFYKADGWMASKYATLAHHDRKGEQVRGVPGMPLEDRLLTGISGLPAGRPPIHAACDASLRAIVLQLKMEYRFQAQCRPRAAIGNACASREFRPP